MRFRYHHGLGRAGKDLVKQFLAKATGLPGPGSPG